MKSPKDSKMSLFLPIFLFLHMSFGDSFAFEIRDRKGSTKLWQAKQERSVEGLDTSSIRNSSSTLLVAPPSHGIFRNGHLNGHRNGHRNGHSIAMPDLPTDEIIDNRKVKLQSEGMLISKGTGDNGTAANATIMSISLRESSNETMVTPNAHLRFQQFQANLQEQWVLLQQDIMVVENDVFRTQQMLGESQHQLSLSQQRVFELQGSLTEMQRKQHLDHEQISQLQRKLDSKTYRQLLGSFFHVTMIKIKNIFGLRWLLSRKRTSSEEESKINR